MKNRNRIIMRTRCCLTLCLAALALSGCDSNTRSIEEKEERNPLIKTGHAFMEQGQWEQAIETLKQAIENEPRMARPHLDLATIYQQHVPNYAHAIYHYDRYLELRPTSEKAAFIEQQKIRVTEALANSLVNNSKNAQQVKSELTRLLQENTLLRNRLKSLQAAAVKTEPAPPDAVKETPTRQPETVSTSQQATHRIYHVIAGDNLSKISSRFYGEAGRWSDIYEANKDRMKSPSDLRVGQTLIIP